MNRTVGFAAAAITVAIAAVAAPSAYAAKATPSESALLFSTLASTSSVSVSAHSTSITLPGNSPTTWFTDRPVRKAGATTVGDLAIQWKSLGFASAPPNAAIVMHQNGQAMQVAVTLSNPRIFGSLVTFTTKQLDSGRVLGMSSRSTMRAGNYGATEIFIDGASSTSGGPGTSTTAGWEAQGYESKLTTYSADCTSVTISRAWVDPSGHFMTSATTQSLGPIDVTLCKNLNWGGTTQSVGSYSLADLMALANSI